MKWILSLLTRDIIFLFVGALLGYLASLIVAKQTERKKELVAEVMNRGIIIEAATACPFDVLDRTGRKLSDVYFICVRIWNRGKDCVVRQDISKESPLFIKIPDEVGVLGEPVFFKDGCEIGLAVSARENNKFELDFECVNAGEWAEIGFFVEGYPKKKLSAGGRIFGQDKDFSFYIDDGVLPIGEWIGIIFLLAMLILCPISLIVGVVWLLRDYSWDTLFVNPGEVPEALKRMLAFGIVIPLMFAVYYIFKWVEKRKHPKSYPADESFEPSQAKAIGAMWGMALSRRRYSVSNSVHNSGEIAPAVLEEKPDSVN
ncbi:hypothetical protein [Chromobacterium vaccinii]|uniref:Uncharacterized protein n=1 Tax=Chromobacterium vaccinii TaxID=1108595 RepID=A0A1D9LC81_9NEIS|nr:hypothetical protein [Chromobacterium vaccinii]AOZ48872.1 hypothetical protein BKX93_01910 [Chromobacterium vaccinii]